VVRPPYHRSCRWLLPQFQQLGDKVFDLVVGLKNLVFDIVAVFVLLGVHVLVQKAAGIFYGVKVVYDKYTLGLLIGVFITFLSFGYWPLFITGYLTYTSIPNLRIGKFRATFRRNGRWPSSPSPDRSPQFCSRSRSTSSALSQEPRCSTASL